MIFDQTTIDKVKVVAETAAQKIMFYYRQPDLKVEIKEDSSPFTLADTASQQIIVGGLNQISSFPIVAEETFDYQNQNVIDSEFFWLVDPIDGTKDFIAHNDEFTVMIALIQDNLPIFGLIYLPAKSICYWAAKGQGSFKNDQKIFNRSTRKNLIGATSRFFRTEADDDFFNKHGVTEVKTYGSSIKFCKLAEGEVDVYPRFGGSKEWDTAAGQIIATEAGCKMIDLKTKQELSYNKGDIQNNQFVASRLDLNFI